MNPIKQRPRLARLIIEADSTNDLKEIDDVVPQERALVGRVQRLIHWRIVA